jgi:Flp pilus assembly protein TadD
MPITKHVFVGRKNELEQFRQALGRPGLVDRLLLRNPGRHAKSRVFLPHGISGIGKSELTRQCLAIADKAGWQTLLLDWDRIGYRPVEPLDVTDALADALQKVGGEGCIGPYLDDRKKMAGIQDKAQRYREGHPEEWQKLLAAVGTVQEKDPEPYSKAALAVLGVTLDVGPKVLARLADAMVARRIIKAEEADLLTRPAVALAWHLAQCIAGLARAGGLVMALDTCEVLSLALEEYLRDQIISPAVEQTNGLIVIVSGRYDQLHAREVETPDGQHRRVKGYADRLADPPPVDWNLSQFAEPEIADYLRECGLEPTPDLVGYVQQTALGVPFAVQLLVEALHALGPERLRQEFPPDPDSVNLPLMVRLVTQRFLHYCLENPTDQSRVRTMALLRERDDAALRAVWQLPDDVSPGSVLDELQSRYGFIQSDRSLHDVVHGFLRESLRTDEREAARRLGSLAAGHYLPLWATETAGFPTLADRVAESRWQRLTLNALNALCWSDEPAAIRFLAGRALEGLEFHWGFAKGLLKLAREFRDTQGWWLSRTGRQLDGLVRAVEGDAKEELAGLEALQPKASELGLDTAALCVLHVRRATSLTAQGRAPEALAACREAEKSLPADESLRRALAQHYADIGGALGYPKGLAVVSREGRAAYEWAIALAPDQSDYHCGLGGLLIAMADWPQAIAYCERAIELDHTNSTAYNYRGSAYYGLKEYGKALADYTQALELDPQDASAYYNRGGTYDDLKEYDKALADYTRAVELDPQDAAAYCNRGSTYADLKEYDKALADYTRAIELDPQYADAYYNTACVYALQEKAAEACECLEKAITLEDECRALARDDADFDKIRGDARFAALVADNG